MYIVLHFYTAFFSKTVHIINVNLMRVQKHETLSENWPHIVVYCIFH